MPLDVLGSSSTVAACDEICFILGQCGRISAKASPESRLERRIGCAKLSNFTAALPPGLGDPTHTPPKAKPLESDSVVRCGCKV